MSGSALFWWLFCAVFGHYMDVTGTVCLRCRQRWGS